MDYQQTIKYLCENLPMFHRIGPAALKNNLDNTLLLDKAFGSPHSNYKTIHVAGTNGKGSVSHFLASVLQCAGYKTGLFTSPHLKDFRERIRVDGKMIPEEDVVSFVDRFIEKNKTMQIHASFFELTSCMAFDFFSKSGVDIAVIEVGLGGRLDSTNIITPALSIITNISYDHTAILGNTLEKIATEKAGIIKRNIPVVIGETQPETEKIFRDTARSQNSLIKFADQSCQVMKHDEGLFSALSANNEFINFEVGLKGDYQQKNLASVLTAIDSLRKGGFSICEENIRDGLRDVTVNTGIMGRWQQIGSHPKVICDTGHNEAGIRFITRQLKNEHYKKLHVIFGMVNDKDTDSILSLLPHDATYYFTKASVERALDEKILQKKASDWNLMGNVYPTTPGALKAARLNADIDDLIFVGGSTFVVAEVV